MLIKLLKARGYNFEFFSFSIAQKCTLIMTEVSSLLVAMMVDMITSIFNTTRKRFHVFKVFAQCIAFKGLN